ncbi:MAG: flavin reductase [Elusimicrobiaceae bacterium]|nr:flavin reductase [Elusimicrobiaceae bacterium]MBR3899207.1 flavin reductase [Elusimicrobiaceae bacterium]
MNQNFIDGLNCISYGLYIVTSSFEGKDSAMIVNTLFQVTAEPAKVAISVNKESLTHDIIQKSRIFAAMPLEQKTDLPFIGRFGFRTGRNFDKFAGLNISRSALGSPIVKEHTLSFLDVKVEKEVDVGTHTLFIGEVQDAKCLLLQTEPMTYEYYHKVIKGKAPKGATHH